MKFIERLKSELVKLRVTFQQDKEAAQAQLCVEVAIDRSEDCSRDPIRRHDKFAGHLRYSHDSCTDKPASATDLQTQIWRKT